MDSVNWFAPTVWRTGTSSETPVWTQASHSSWPTMLRSKSTTWSLTRLLEQVSWVCPHSYTHLLTPHHYQKDSIVKYKTMTKELWNSFRDSFLSPLHHTFPLRSVLKVHYGTCFFWLRKTDFFREPVGSVLSFWSLRLWIGYWLQHYSW